MPVITQIKPQRRANRVNIYLDGKFGFGMNLEHFMKCHLKVGVDLTEKQIDEIVRKDAFQGILAILLKFATMRPRSIAEIQGWFIKHKVYQSLQKDLLDKLKHFNLIDDEAFASWWVDQRMQFKSKSKREIKQELKVKKISDDVISRVLEKSELDEAKSVKKLLAKNAYKWEKLDKRVREQKIIQFLLRKGFDWEVVKKALKDYDLASSDIETTDY